jgi:hypothetical protein
MLPKRKVYVGALAGAVVAIAVWALHVFAHTVQPPEIIAAEVVIVSAAAAYLIPEADQA